jgi:hypothetical protein
MWSNVQVEPRNQAAFRLTAHRIAAFVTQLSYCLSKRLQWNERANGLPEGPMRLVRPPQRVSYLLRLVTCSLIGLLYAIHSTGPRKTVNRTKGQTDCPKVPCNLSVRASASRTCCASSPSS